MRKILDELLTRLESRVDLDVGPSDGRSALEWQVLLDSGVENLAHEVHVDFWRKRLLDVAATALAGVMACDRNRGVEGKS